MRVAGANVMAYYQQTVLIPKPKQTLNTGVRHYDSRSARIGNTKNTANRNLNSILAFFD